MKKIIGLLAFSCASTFSILPSAALAGTATSSVNVSTTVVQACAISTTGSLAFGNFNPISTNAGGTGINAAGAALTSSGAAINVQCTNGSSGMWVGLLSINKSSSTDGSGTLQNASHTMTYSVYQDNGYTKPWLNNNSIATNTPTITADGTTHSYTIYAKIPNNQDTAYLGAYTDTITATVNF